MYRGYVSTVFFFRTEENLPLYVFVNYLFISNSFVCTFSPLIPHRSIARLACVRARPSLVLEDLTDGIDDVINRAPVTVLPSDGRGRQRRRCG